MASFALAQQLDQQDPLAHFRSEFAVDDAELIYLDGNSLGRLPRRTIERLREVAAVQWGQRLVRGWNDGWFEAASRIGGKIAPLLGARSGEVIMADSTSVNLFKLVLAALQCQRGRNKIVSDELNFPSDLYVLQGIARIAGDGYHIETVRSADGLSISADALASSIDSSTAIVALTHTCFKSGFVHDLPRITEMAHRAGSLILWDLSHSVGVMPLDLNSAEVDLAVGCTYKYLNGGPGAPAFLYVRDELQEQLQSPIWGWFGRRSQFDLSLNYEPASGIHRFLAGTPPILSLAAVEPGIDLVIEAGVDRIRAKSARQTEFLIELWREQLEPLGVTLNSPLDSQRRGSHVSLGHPEGLRVARALMEKMQVIPDFRRPDNIRFGIAPLYTSYREIHTGVARLRRVLDERLFEKFGAETLTVT